MPSNDHVSPPKDAIANQADARIRELLSSLPVSAADADFEHRVLAKIRRRRLAVRSTCAASLIVFLVAAWVISTGDKNPRQPAFAVKDRSPVNSANLPGASLNGASLNEVELFAAAYQGLASPVVQLEAHENELQALWWYLSSPEAKMEKE